MNFFYCTMTGIGVALLFMACLGAVIFLLMGIGYGVEKLRSVSPRLHRSIRLTGKILGRCVLAILIATASTGVILAMHDWGCDIKGHPEHKILVDGKTPSLSHH